MRVRGRGRPAVLAAPVQENGMPNLLPTRPAHLAMLAAAACGGPYAYFNGPEMINGGAGGAATTLTAASLGGDAAIDGVAARPTCRVAGLGQPPA